MTIGRAKGYTVTHQPSEAMRRPGTETKPFRRCTCGRPFYADTPEAAQALFDEHLDRMEAKGRKVLRPR